jgi:hypothetical protein
MKAETTNAMEEAKMDARMVFAAAEDYASTLAAAAHKAIAKAERTGSAFDSVVADGACETWIDANEDAAVTVIHKRIAARAAHAERLAVPLTDAQLGM